MYNACKVFCFTGVVINKALQSDFYEVYMDNLLFLSVLFEYYGNLLTDRQYEICDMYINQNLSLGEISDILGISRQGVRDGLIKAEKLLINYEDKLKIFDKNTKLSQMLDDIQRLLVNIENNELADEITKITDKISDLI